MSTETLLAGFGLALGVAAALTPVVRAVAVRLRWLDRPNERSSHTMPTPRVGGIAFIIAMMTAASTTVQHQNRELYLIALGAVLVSVSGLLDDLRPLGVAMKFLPQALAAAIAVAMIDPTITVDAPVLALAIPEPVARIAAVLWIVVMINAFNFLDGLDGLAAGVAAIAAAAVGVMAGGTAAQILLPLAGAMVGFLIWNTQPARIFMGDVGSQFVGYALGVSVFLGDGGTAHAIPTLLVFGPVLGDAAITTLRRLGTGRSPFRADRNHVFHVLAAAGHDHRTVARVYYAATAVSVGLAYVYLEVEDRGEAALLAAAAAALLAVAAGTSSGVPAREVGSRTIRAGTQRTKVTNG